MTEMMYDELLSVNGGKIETLSDVFLCVGGIFACFVSPPLGIAIVVIAALV